MQVPAPVEYARATSVDHAIALLERLGDEARIVAGGHSLLPMMKLRLANPEYLVDINDLTAELGYIIVDPTLVRIGAMTRHREALASDDLAAVCPIFRDAERVIADRTQVADGVAEPRQPDRHVHLGTGQPEPESIGFVQRPVIGGDEHRHDLAEGDDLSHPNPSPPGRSATRSRLPPPSRHRPAESRRWFPVLR